MALFPPTAFLALVFATALVSVGTSASASTACSGPAPIPYGYLLGQVERVDAAGNARIGDSNPKAMAFMVLTSTRRGSSTKLLVNVDDLRSAERVRVTLRTARCFGPEPIDAPSSV